MATLTIQISSGTMMNMDTNVAVKLAKAAVDKGYAVRIFGYGEGITMVKTGQDPKAIPERREHLRIACEGGGRDSRLYHMLRCKGS